MKNNKGFTLIELLAVIVVLAIVMVLATTTVLPYMGEAREKSFRIEATNLVKSAESAKDLYTLGQAKLNTDATKSCSSTTKMCFTVAELIDLGIYEGDKDSYKGKVEITNYSGVNPTYTLYLSKGSEFYINGGTVRDYTNTDVSLASTVADGYDSCSCS